MKEKQSKRLIYILLVVSIIFISVFTYSISQPSKLLPPKELVILSPNSQAILTGTIPAFEEKYGIKVKLIQGGTGQLIDRLSKEGKQLKADIFFGGNYTQFESHKALFESYVSKNVHTVIPDYIHPSDTATPYTINGSVLIVNNELAKGLTIKSYEDLLQPSLKGKIAFGQSTSNRPIRKDAQTSNGMKALKDIATLKEDYRYVTKHKGQILKTYNRIRRNAD
ncbi:extracellular solute-binding protein [Streptococcus agalactiae]